MEVGLAVDFTVESDENGLVALDVGTTMKAGVNNDPFAEVQKALGGSIGSLKAELERTALLEKKAAEAKAAPEPEPMEEEQEAEAEEEEQAYGEEESWGQEATQENGEEEEEDDDAPLPPGWEAIWSDEHECYYYWHKASKTPAWDRPKAPIKPTPAPPKAKAAATQPPKAKAAVSQPKAAEKGVLKGKGAGKSKTPIKQPVQEDSYHEEEEAENYEEEEPQAGQKRKPAPKAPGAANASKNQAWKGGGKRQKYW